MPKLLINNINLDNSVNKEDNISPLIDFNNRSVKIESLFNGSIITEWDISKIATTLDYDYWGGFKYRPPVGYTPRFGASISMESPNGNVDNIFIDTEINGEGDREYKIQTYDILEGVRNLKYYGIFSDRYSFNGSAITIGDQKHSSDEIFHSLGGTKSMYSTDKQMKSFVNLGVDNGSYTDKQSFLIPFSTSLGTDIYDYFTKDIISSWKHYGDAWYSLKYSMVDDGVYKNTWCMSFILPSDAPKRDMLLLSSEILVPASLTYNNVTFKRNSYYDDLGSGGVTDTLPRFNNRKIIDKSNIMVNEDTSYSMINNGGKIGITIVIKYDGGSSSHKLYIYISDILFHEQQIKKSSLTWDELKNAVDDFPISESDINTILFNVAAEEEYDKNIEYDSRGIIPEWIIAAKLKTIINGIYSETEYKEIPEYNDLSFSLDEENVGYFDNTNRVDGNEFVEVDGSKIIRKDIYKKVKLSEYLPINGTGSLDDGYDLKYSDAMPTEGIVFGGYEFESGANYLLTGCIGNIYITTLDLSKELEGLTYSTIINAIKNNSGSIYEKKDEYFDNDAGSLKLSYETIVLHKNSSRNITITNVDNNAYIEEYSYMPEVKKVEDMITLKAHIVECVACLDAEPEPVLMTNVNLGSTNVACINNKSLDIPILDYYQLSGITEYLDKDILNITIDASKGRSFYIDENLAKAKLSITNKVFNDVYGNIRSFALTINVINLEDGKSLNLVIKEFNEYDYISHVNRICEKDYTIPDLSPEILNRTTIKLIDSEGDNKSETFIHKNLWFDASTAINFREKYKLLNYKRYSHTKYDVFDKSLNSVVVLDKDSNPEDPYRNISCISPIRSHMSDGEMLFHRMPKFHIKYKNLSDMNSIGDKDNPIYEVYPPNGLPEESTLDSIIEYIRSPDGEDFAISSRFNSTIYVSSDDIETYQDKFDFVNTRSSESFYFPYATEEDLDYTWMVDQARFSDKCIAVKKTSLAGSAHKEVSDRW